MRFASLNLKHISRHATHKGKEVQEMNGYYTRYSFRVKEGAILEFVNEAEAKEYLDEETTKETN